jgi:hypothetical protein
MDPFLALLVVGAVFVFLQTRKEEPRQASSSSSSSEKQDLVPADADAPRVVSDYYTDGEPRVRAALARVFTDPLSAAGKAASLPAGLVPGTTSFGADAPLYGGERMTMAVADSEGTVQGVLEGTFSGPYDPDEGPSALLADRVAMQRSIAFEVPGKYTVPASAKHTYHDRLRRVVWSVRDPIEKDLRGFEETFTVDPNDKVTILLRDDYGTYVVGIAQVREVKEGGVLRVLLLNPYEVLVDEGQGSVTFTRMLNQGLVDVKFSQLVNPKSLKKT